ncbi:hypothetical protein DB347_24205 [Opitutaceae bacterium EW11]|nr:hypothetical protein DB347_24205 [Opitutaceae bacterium EW11]
MRISAILRRFVFQAPVVVSCVVLVGAGCSYWVSRTIRLAEEERARDVLLRHARAEQQRVQEQVSARFAALERLGSPFAFRRIEDQAAFRSVAHRIAETHPEFVRIEWAPFVAAGDRLAFEQRIQKSASPTLHIQGAVDPAADAYPVQYIEGPSSAAADLARDLRTSDFAAALDLARAHRRPVLTGKYPASLSGQPDEVVAYILPVFAAETNAVGSSNQDDFLGFAIGVVRAAEVLSSLRQGSAEVATDILVLDATPGTPPSSRQIFYRTADLDPSTPSEAEFRSHWFTEIPVAIGERVWLVLHRGNTAWLSGQGSALPLLFLFGGLVLTGSIAAYVFSAFRAQSGSAEDKSETSPTSGSSVDAIPDASAAAQLRRSQQLLNALMENSPSGIFVKDVQGRYLAVNRQFAEMYRRSREEFVGRSDLDLFSPEVASRLRLSDTRVLSSAKPIELEESFSLPAGTHTSIIHKFPLIGEDGRVHGLCGITTDISERKRAEAEIRENRRQLESLLGQLPGMAFRLINDGQMTPVYVSRGALGLTGHGARDFIEGVVRIPDVIHPEDRERSRNAIAGAVKKRRGFEVEYRIIDRSGKTKWVLERGQGVFDEEGKLLFIEGLAIDITQRKDAESEKLLVERRLLEGQKLESIGVLAGGIAHDFNNLLTGIIGNANLAALELPSASKVQGNLKQIEVASQRAAELCQQMLAYAGKGRFVVQRIEFGHLVETTVPLLRASISKRAHLKFELTPGVPAILADPTQMRQIVMNLVLNASEALGEQDGEITISTKILKPTEEYLVGAVLAPPELGNDFVVLEVRDTGCGMTQETIAKIFDPFFTTKFAGRGLGLAAVLGIIRSHKGALKVTSKPGVGSTFTLLFPVVPGPTEVGIVRKNTAAPWRQEGLALIVDDEDHVRNVTAGMLNTCGLRTETARDGYEGLDLFRAKPQSFDIVLLDMTMPRLSGEETLLLLREIRPEVRVLFMSGYNRREVVETLAGDGVLSFIQKPFTLETLREHLQQILA